MATKAEVLAAAAKADAAGDTAGAAKLRAYAATLSEPATSAKPDAATIMAAQQRALEAGDTEAFNKLATYLRENYAQAPASAQDAPATPPRADAPASPPSAPRVDTFGETATRAMQGPYDAMAAFGGGLAGGPSPTWQGMNNDPWMRTFPDAVKAPLAFAGDIGGAALSAVGTGLAGAIGLGSELVPGQNSRNEARLTNDLMAMSQFAVPELAGVSSVAGRMATAAPRVAPVAPVTETALDVAAAQARGIPVLRTDVAPPRTAIGKIAGRIGEGIPIAGTGQVRAGQNAARITAAQDLVRQFGADTIAPMIDDVTASVLAKRGDDLARFTGQKAEIINAIPGVVPAVKAVAAIDEQIAKLTAQGMSALQPVIKELQDFRNGVTGKTLPVIEQNRKVIGSAFADPSLAAIRDVGEKALSAVYGPLREDMGDFIRSTAGNGAFSAWKSANDKLASMAGELGNAALKRLLDKGSDTPEVVRGLLFSQKPSDVRLLYRNLTPEGQAAARTAVIQEALAKAGDLASLSPEKFKTALGKLSAPIGVMFRGPDLEAVTGLVRALKLTERASFAGAAPLTGVQNMPALVTGLIGAYTGSIPATAAVLGGIGGIARIYEATGVKSALRRLAKAETPQAQANVLKTLEDAIKDASPPVAPPAAAQDAVDDYDALYGRY